MKRSLLCDDYLSPLGDLRQIRKKSERSQWSVEQIDFATPAATGDYGRVMEGKVLAFAPAIKRLSKKKKEAFAKQLVAFEFSQILHGEQAALLVAGQLISAAPDLEARMFAASQAKDEARHVEAITEVVQRIGPIYPVHTRLRNFLEELALCGSWPKQIIGLQLFLEARALLTFREHLLYVDDPSFKDAILRIERDEAKHVGFGVRYIDRAIQGSTPEEREALMRYTYDLVQNHFVLTRGDDFRPAFEEAGLDMDEVYASIPDLSTNDVYAFRTRNKGAYDLFDRFGRWFFSTMNKAGLMHESDLRIPKRRGDAERFEWEADSQL